MNKLEAGCLVVYKSRPARVTGVTDKIDISFSGGSKRVRDKDVLFLHPGPVASLDNLDAGEGELDEAIELLEGESTSLPELAALLYGDYTPAAAWSAWELLSEGLYFEGTPEELHPRDPRQVREEIAERVLKEQRKAAWDALIARLAAGEMEEEDRPELTEVERLALGQSETSRILQALDVGQTREHAHQLLLRVGYWPEAFNPHPLRTGVALQEPAIPVPELPDEERLDLTHLDAWAIDDAGSKDPDDAISIDGERLWVHIADAGALAPPGSDLDTAACERGANLYLPEAIVPMFPHGMTERLGLGLKETSPALSVGFEIDAAGNLQEIGVHLATVRVTRMTYAEATVSDDSRLQAIAAMLARFRERRMQAGAAGIDLPEVSVRLDGDEILIRPLERGGSRQMVAEAMMAAGEAIAEFALRNDILIPFANQPPPDETRTPESMSEMFAYRKLFKPSRMATQPERHFGLGLDHYTRVTSPLRRYPDLVTHQQIRAFLKQEPLLDEETIVERVGEASAASSLVRRAERFSNLHWKMVWLSRQQNWQGEAVIVDLEQRKATLLVPELALESRVRRTPEMALDQRLVVSLQSLDFTVPEARFRVRKS